MASTTSDTAPKEVIINGTLCLTHNLTSASNRGFVGCTIKLTPNGAAFLPVCSSNSFNLDLISINHSSKPSLERWFKAGKVPTIPFLQHSITNCGPDIKNMGAATIGNDNSLMKAGLFDILK